MTEVQRETIKVAGRSNVGSVAGSIMHLINEGKRVSAIAIGAGAVNQMVKAAILARSMATSSGRDLYFTMAFKDEMTPEGHKVAIQLFVHEKE